MYLVLFINLYSDIKTDGKRFISNSYQKLKSDGKHVLKNSYYAMKETGRQGFSKSYEYLKKNGPDYKIFNESLERLNNTGKNAVNKLAKLEDSLSNTGKSILTGLNHVKEKGKNLYKSSAGFMSKKGDAIMSRLDNLKTKTMNAKWFEKAATYGKKVKLAGPAASIASIGVNGYYNLQDDRVKRDYNEGKAVRASTKVVVGTIIDSAQNCGVIDGVVSGAMVGGVPGAIAGGLVGGLNQGLQFMYPKGYKKVKDGAYKAVDYAADKATKVGKSITKSVNKTKNAIAGGFKKVFSSPKGLFA